MTARETVAAKSIRYLAEGRLTVTRRDGERVEATCTGSDGTVYDLGHQPDRPGVWTCTCPAMGRCSHTTALRLVIIPNTAERTPTT